MRAKLLLAITCLSVLGAFNVAQADHGCNGDIQQSVPVEGKTYYVDYRGDIEGPYIYEESNGIAGLQSGGHKDIAGAYQYDDPCSHETPDTLIY